MPHPFIGDVNDLIDKVRQYSNLKIESNLYRRIGPHNRSIVLQKEADNTLNDVENILYELIDKSFEDGARSEVATHHS